MSYVPKIEKNKLQLQIVQTNIAIFGLKTDAMVIVIKIFFK